LMARWRTDKIVCNSVEDEAAAWVSLKL
jgi:hypothetical protein